MYVVATSEAIRWFIKRRGLALAIVTCGVGLGSMWIAPVAAQFIESFGWRLSFVFIGLIAVITIIPSSLFLRRAPTEIAALSEDKNKGTVEINALDNQQKETKEFSSRQAAKTRNFWLLIGIWVFHSFCLFTITTHIVPYAIDSGISSLEAAPILSVLGFASIPSRILLGALTDRVGRKSIALMSALLMVAAMVWLMQSSSLWMLYVFAIAFGIASGGLSPSTMAMVSDSFGTRHIGSIMGVLEIGWVLGAAAGPVLAGYIFDTTHKYFLAFLSMAIASLMVTILVLFIKSPKAKKEDEY
jgi:MFS family permease